MLMKNKFLLKKKIYLKFNFKDIKDLIFPKFYITFNTPKLVIPVFLNHHKLQ